MESQQQQSVEEIIDIERYVTIVSQLLSAHSDFMFNFIHADTNYPLRFLTDSLSFHLLSLEEFERFLNSQWRQS